MFEKSLTEKLKRIFDLKKVSFDDPGESLEQETLFIEIENARATIKDGRAIARVNGRAIVYANNDKLPFGYFAKAIAKADPSDTKDLFFFGLEENTRLFQNKIQRGFSFVYFFNSQYDPAQGTITQTTIEVNAT